MRCKCGHRRDEHAQMKGKCAGHRNGVLVECPCKRFRPYEAPRIKRFTVEE
jgi:hypothetical protein